jgi:hypothetical protein
LREHPGQALTSRRLCSTVHSLERVRAKGVFRSVNTRNAHTYTRTHRHANTACSSLYTYIHQSTLASTTRKPTHVAARPATPANSAHPHKYLLAHATHNTQKSTQRTTHPQSTKHTQHATHNAQLGRPRDEQAQPCGCSRWRCVGAPCPRGAHVPRTGRHP